MPVRRLVTLPTVLLCLGLGLASLWMHAFSGRLGPESTLPHDMLAYFERAADPTFLQGDFSTDAVAMPNPRQVFGRLVMTLARAFDGDWMRALFSLKLLLAVLMPPLFFLACRRLVWSWQPDLRQNAWLDLFLLAGTLVLTQFGRLNFWLSVASWPPYAWVPQAQTTSLLFCLAGFVLLARQPWLGALLAFAGALLHPVVALLAWTFALGMSLAVSTGALRQALAGLGACVAGALTVAVAFRDPQALPAAEFIELYIRQAHDFHFLPTEMASNTRLPGSFHYMVGLVGLATPWLALRYLKPHAVTAGLRRATGLATALYIAVLPVSWLGLELISFKAVAIIGPIRFVQYWAWSALCLAAYALLLAFPRLPQVPVVAGRTIRAGIWVGFLALLGTVAYMQSRLYEHPYGLIRDEAPAFYSWVQATPEGSLFASPIRLAAGIVAIGRRPVLHGVGFPFREGILPEHTQRYQWAFGTVQQRRPLELAPGQWGTGAEKVFHQRQNRAHLVEGRSKFGVRFVVWDASRYIPIAGLEPVYKDGRQVVVDLSKL